MGNLYRPHRHLPTHTYPLSVVEIPQVLPQRRHLSVYQPPFRPGHGPVDFHQHGKGSQTVSLATRHTNPSIPGQLADSRPLQRGVQQTDSETVKPSKRFGLCSEPQEIRAGTLPEIRLPGIPFFTFVKPTQDRWTKIQEMFRLLSSKSVISARTLMSTTG